MAVHSAVEQACKALGVTCSCDDSLGRGRFGEVFKAVNNESGEVHALKICLDEPNDPRVLLYLKSEIDLQRKINHKNIVRMYNALLTDKFAAMEMELCQMNLSQLMKTCGVVIKKGGDFIPDLIVMPEEALRPLARDILRGLAAIHKMGVFHRDIKPENILVALDKYGIFSAKISDFGLAKPINESTFSQVGTLSYMAPEMYEFSSETGGAVYDARCDIWSLGVTLYIMLSGVPPVIERDSPSTELPKNIQFSDCCRQFISGMLMRDPKLRFSSKDALHHPFAMPKVRVTQLVKPDSSVGVVGSKIQEIELGDIAFNNEVKKSSLEAVMKQIPVSSIKWSVTREDVLNALGFTDCKDLLVFTNGGKVIKENSVIEYSDDDDLDLVVISKKDAFPRIDPAVVAAGNDAVMKQAAKMKADADGVDFLVKELKERIAFCDLLARPNMLIDHLQRVISMDALIKELNDLQQKITSKAPAFPTVAVAEERRDYKVPESVAAESEAIESLKKELRGICITVNDKKKLSQKTFDDEFASLKTLLNAWAGPKPCSCIQHAIDAKNAILDDARSNISVLLRIVDYIEILRSALEMDHPQDVVPELTKIISSCPCFQLADGHKAMLHECTETDDENDPVKLLKIQLNIQQDTYTMLQSQIAELEESQKDMLEKSMKYIRQYKATIAKLQACLEQNSLASTFNSEDKLHV